MCIALVLHIAAARYGSVAAAAYMGDNQWSEHTTRHSQRYLITNQAEQLDPELTTTSPLPTQRTPYLPSHLLIPHQTLPPPLAAGAALAAATVRLVYWFPRVSNAPQQNSAQYDNMTKNYSQPWTLVLKLLHSTVHIESQVLIEAKCGWRGAGRRGGGSLRHPVMDPVGSCREPYSDLAAFCQDPL